jgi:dephospho-CoA kinase
MPVIGLTGGIATGKSTVGRLLKERGANLFSADEVARAVTAPGSPVLERIEREFGSGFIQADGTLDRAALGELVFSDSEARTKLDKITHPAILDEIARLIVEARAANPDGLIVVEAPLLFEAGMEDWFDKVVTVVASPEVQRARLAARSGLSLAEVDARIQSQMELSEKAARSDFVIENDGGLDELSRSVQRLLPSLLRVDKS